jgi:hypothetical protein
MGVIDTMKTEISTAHHIYTQYSTTISSIYIIKKSIVVNCLYDALIKILYGTLFIMK